MRLLLLFSLVSLPFLAPSLALPHPSFDLVVRHQSHSNADNHLHESNPREIVDWDIDTRSNVPAASNSLVTRARKKPMPKKGKGPGAKTPRKSKPKLKAPKHPVPPIEMRPPIPAPRNPRPGRADRNNPKFYTSKPSKADRNAAKKLGAEAARERKAKMRLDHPPPPGPRRAGGPHPKSASQIAADGRAQARKAAGKEKFGEAAAKHRLTAGLPGRKTKFDVGGVTYTGKDARIANFNSHLFSKNKVGDGRADSPSTFQNRLQGPAANRHHPLPGMNGPGKEFPMTPGNPNGYQSGPKGTVRVVTQPTSGFRQDPKTGSVYRGSQYMGVIAHNPNVPPGDPGYNDHHKIIGQKHKNPKT